MFSETFQSGLLSLFYSCGSHPLKIWAHETHDGRIELTDDEDIESQVLELTTNLNHSVATTYITCPLHPERTLGIRLQFFVMIVKNLRKFFTFELHILDDKKITRRFRASNFQSVVRIHPYICTMPLKLDDGWNQIQLNLNDLVCKTYGTTYIETQRIHVHANCRIRRIYFSEHLLDESQLPTEFRLFVSKKKLMGQNENDSMP